LIHVAGEFASEHKKAVDYLLEEDHVLEQNQKRED